LACPPLQWTLGDAPLSFTVLKQQKDGKMNKKEIYRFIDLFVISVANLFNIIMVVVFYLRTRNVNHPKAFGYVWTVFVIILVAASILNIRSKLSWWSIALPLIFAAFLILELILDYLLQIDFRNTSLLAPYLLLYYVSILGMIGYSFLTEKKLGIFTLVTYFLSQIAAFYSYFNVGHG
jgi:hypothetical protein